MELRRYHGRDHTAIEYEAVQVTPENIEEVAKHFQLEYVKAYVDEDGTEQALFRPGYSGAVHVGDFIVQKVNSNQQAYAVLASEFNYFYREIKEHPFVPQITYSSDNDRYPRPCVFCGHEYDDVPYHRDGIPGEVLKLPDGGTLRIIVK